MFLVVKNPHAISATSRIFALSRISDDVDRSFRDKVVKLSFTVEYVPKGWAKA